MGLVVGTCSLCGGGVMLPSIWHGVDSPPAQCDECGAIAQNPGPVIPMEPQKPYGRGISNLPINYRMDEGDNPPTAQFLQE